MFSASLRHSNIVHESSMKGQGKKHVLSLQLLLPKVGGQDFSFSLSLILYFQPPKHEAEARE